MYLLSALVEYLLRPLYWLPGEPVQPAEDSMPDQDQGFLKYSNVVFSLVDKDLLAMRGLTFSPVNSTFFYRTQKMPCNHHNHLSRCFVFLSLCQSELFCNTVSKEQGYFLLFTPLELKNYDVYSNIFYICTSSVSNNVVLTTL